MEQFPPAFCPEHGFFPSRAINLAGSRGITLSNMVDQCPMCGRKCEILPGTYDAIPNGFNLLMDPSVSIEALTAIKALAEKVQKQEITVVQAQQQAERIAPGTGKFFNVREWSDGAKATLYAGILTSATALAIAAYASRGGGNVTNNYFYNVPPPPAVTEPVEPVVNQQGEVKRLRKFDLLKAGKIKLQRRKSKGRR